MNNNNDKDNIKEVVLDVDNANASASASASVSASASASASANVVNNKNNNINYDVGVDSEMNGQGILRDINYNLSWKKEIRLDHPNKEGAKSGESNSTNKKKYNEQQKINTKHLQLGWNKTDALNVLIFCCFRLNSLDGLLAYTHLGKGSYLDSLENYKPLEFQDGVNGVVIVISYFPSYFIKKYGSNDQISVYSVIDVLEDVWFIIRLLNKNPNVLIIFHGLRWSQIINMFKLNNINVYGVKPTIRHTSNTLQITLMKYLLELYGSIDRVQSSLIVEPKFSHYWNIAKADYFSFPADPVMNVSGEVVRNRGLERKLTNLSSDNNRSVLSREHYPVLSKEWFGLAQKEFIELSNLSSKLYTVYLIVKDAHSTLERIKTRINELNSNISANERILKILNEKLEESTMVYEELKLWVLAFCLLTFGGSVIPFYYSSSISALPFFNKIGG